MVLVREEVAHKQGRQRRKRKKEVEDELLGLWSLVFCLRASLSLLF